MKDSQARSDLAACLVGAGEINKAKAVFAEAQRLPEDRTRQHPFLRIAAQLGDPSATDALK